MLTAPRFGLRPEGFRAFLRIVSYPVTALGLGTWCPASIRGPLPPLPGLTRAPLPHRYSALSEPEEQFAMATWEERWWKFVAQLARGPK